MIGTCDLRQDQTSTHQRCCSRVKQFWWTAVHGSWKWSWVTPKAAWLKREAASKTICAVSGFSLVSKCSRYTAGKHNEWFFCEQPWWHGIMKHVSRMEITMFPPWPYHVDTGNIIWLQVGLHHLDLPSVTNSWPDYVQIPWPILLVNFHGTGKALLSVSTILSYPIFNHLEIQLEVV